MCRDVIRACRRDSLRDIQVQAFLSRESTNLKRRAGQAYNLFNIFGIIFTAMKGGHSISYL